MVYLTRTDHQRAVGARWRWIASARGVAVFVGLAMFILTPKLRAAVDDAGRVALPGSIKAVPTTTTDARAAHITRANLQPAEENAVMQFALSLKMRNFQELQTRLAHGELISPAEMADKYWPLQSDYDAAVAWLQTQGFSVSNATPSNILVAASGTVAQVRTAFQVSFARVASEGAEFTSAVTAPSVPASLAPLLIGVNGLQPHLRKHPHIMHPTDATAFVPPYFPKQIMQAYGANTLSLDGSGQAIGIIMDAYPENSDLTSFWTTTGTSQSLGNITDVPVNGGPTASFDSGDAEEVSLDVEWSSSIAPAAHIRIYGTPSLADSNSDLAYQQVYNDASTNPQLGLHVVSMSYGGSEPSDSQLLTDDQLFAQMVSIGITPFASSGDDGSSFASTPATDPNVTAVGGTSITLNTTTGVITSETGWSGSGGGSSAYFSKPSWQTGTGVSGSISTREVPDVAAPADPNTGALLVWEDGNSTTIGGTSWSSPTWAGFAALINQARANLGGQPLGLLGPRIYPLLGTSSFRDITSGSNGDFSAGVGYDLVTGIGVPAFPDLLNQLTQPSQLTLAFSSAVDVEVNAGENAVFSFSAASSATSFQWQRMAANTDTWENLSDNATYSGSTTPTLAINATTAAMSGDQFRCVVNGSIPPAVALVVIPVPLYATTLAGQVGVTGTANGLGAAAQFNEPNMAVLDASGNLYVADYSNDAIRKVTPSGNVTTYSGDPGVFGDTNGNATTARFNGINAVVFDASSNMYVADSLNNAIRKITPAGNVTTFAGSTTGRSGSTDGHGTSARFNFPSGVAVAPNGTIYVADSSNNLIREITPGGNVTTLAGNANVAGSTDGLGTNATFNNPFAVAVDSTGNIFVADIGNDLIRKITPAGNVTTLAGSAGNPGIVDGTGSFARFNSPSGIAVDSSGNVYVADTSNNAIRKVTQAGVVTTIAGQSGVVGSANGIGKTIQFNQPYGVIINNTTGVIYVTDTFNNTMRELQALGAPQLQTQSGNVTIAQGNSTTFSVNATGVPPPTYQWQILENGDSTWSNLTDDDTYNGSTTANLTVNSTTWAMDGNQFQCLISNAAGNITSVPSILTLQSIQPSFTTQPTSQAVNDGDAATITVAATGLPDVLTYQWQMLTGVVWGNLSDNGTITGSNTTTFTINPTNTTLGGAQFRVLASNGIDPATASNAVTLTVYPAGYQTWAASLNLTGANLSLSARPFGDTIPNLVRFAMNLGVPATSSELPALATQVVNSTPMLTLTYNVNNNLTDEQVIAQYSYDLQTWQNVDSGATVQLANPNSQTSSYQASVAIPASGTVFLRLVVEPAP